MSTAPKDTATAEAASPAAKAEDIISEIPKATTVAAVTTIPAVAATETETGEKAAETEASTTMEPATVEPVSESIEAELEAEDDALAAASASSVSDADEAYGSDAESSATTSLSSSVRDYTFENSRRYHRYQEGKYHFPNDEPEQEREDMRHSMVVHVCGGSLHYAPLEAPQKILDIGTGTGIWAIDMGDEYPEAEVIGIDLSPIQPVWVPPNVRFIVDDVEGEWMYPPNSLDFVHIRHMAPAIKDWPKLMAQAYSALKPGGWIEIQDLNWIYLCDDGTMPEDYGMLQMAGHIRNGLKAFGIQLNAVEIAPQRLAETGFIDVRHRKDKVPVGTWPRDNNLKTIGLYNRSTIYDGLYGITVGPLTRGLKWSADDVELFLVKVRKDLMNTRIHSYVYLHTICAQKPL